MRMPRATDLDRRVAWPPRDTDRNFFLGYAQVLVYALVALWFVRLALGSGAPVPWVIFTVALAATLVVVVALVLMHAQRRARREPETAPAESAETAETAESQS